MDCSINRGNGKEPKEEVSTINYKVFDEYYPFYRHIGMSSEEYWDGEPMLTQYFLRHYISLKKEEENRLNRESWLQGIYLQYAIASVFNEKAEYPFEPINWNETDEEREDREIRELNVRNSIKAQKLLDSLD